MSAHYLFGPLPTLFAGQHLEKQRRAGTCLTFGDNDEADLKIAADDGWETIRSRLPANWAPDFVALWLSHGRVPSALWSAPVPLAALVEDWDLLWHTYRHRLPGCELILIDPDGAEAVRKQGLSHVLPADLSRFDSAPDPREGSAPSRDIDVLLTGTRQPGALPEAAPWLSRLARLGTRWRVVADEGTSKTEFARLLSRSRIVFPFRPNRRYNPEALAAAAAGALVFQMKEQPQLPAEFRDRQECVCYTAHDVESLVEHYLGHEEDRQSATAQARVRAREHSFERLWEGYLAAIEHQLPNFAERGGRRPPLLSREAVASKAWEIVTTLEGRQMGLENPTGDLADRTEEASLHNALGLAAAFGRPGAGGLTPASAEQALAHFRKAWQTDPTQAVAGMNLAEVLAVVGRSAEAVEQAKGTLALLDGRREIPALDAAPFPPVVDVFRVEWERAAWVHAGDPPGELHAKQSLIQCRLHALLGELSGDLAHFYEAILV